MSDFMKKRIAVLITGADGMIYVYRFLKVLSDMEDIETYLVISKSGAMVMKYELGVDLKDLKSLVDFSYDEGNFMAPLASGSFRLDGTLVAPCSMKTLSGIASGFEDNLIIRAASIAIKEKRKLVVMPRETPLSTIHIKNMLTLAEAGAIIMPPFPPFYFKTKNADELVDLIVGRMLSMFDIKNNLVKEWGATKGSPDNIPEKDQ